MNNNNGPDQVIVNKKRELAELWSLLSMLTIERNWKKEKRKMDLARELKKTVEHESNGHAICTWGS